MSDRLNSRIRALVVELVSDPVQPPAFPREQTATQRARPPRRRWPGWSVGVAAFIVVIGLGVAAFLWVPTRHKPLSPSSPQQAVDDLVGALNAGDLDAALSLFADDAQCVAPGLPTCGDILGFLVAADGVVTFEGCVVNIEPYLQCDGYVHTSIHDALGITSEELALEPNFLPAFIVEDGLIIQFNFATPFTGNREMDARLWRYLLSQGADYVDQDGVPRFSAEIVPRFLEDARKFTENAGS